MDRPGIPLQVELYSQLPLDVWAPHPTSQAKPSRSLEKPHFGHFRSTSCPVGHHPELVNIGEAWNVDRPVNWELHLVAQLILYRNGSVQHLQYHRRCRPASSFMNNTLKYLNTLARSSSSPLKSKRCRYICYVMSCFVCKQKAMYLKKKKNTQVHMDKMCGWRQTMPLWFPGLPRCVASTCFLHQEWVSSFCTCTIMWYPRVYCEFLYKIPRIYKCPLKPLIQAPDLAAFDSLSASWNLFNLSSWSLCLPNGSSTSSTLNLLSSSML